MNTKYFVVLLFIASAHAAKLLDPFHPVREKCRRQFNFSIEKLKESKNHLERIAPYLLCFIVELNALTDDGFINEIATVNLLSPLIPITISVPLIHSCNHQVLISRAKNLSDRVLVFYKCMTENVHPVMYNLVGFLAPPVYTW